MDAVGVTGSSSVLLDQHAPTAEKAASALSMDPLAQLQRMDAELDEALAELRALQNLLQPLRPLIEQDGPPVLLPEPEPSPTSELGALVASLRDRVRVLRLAVRQTRLEIDLPQR